MNGLDDFNADIFGASSDGGAGDDPFGSPQGGKKEPGNQPSGDFGSEFSQPDAMKLVFSPAKAAAAAAGGVIGSIFGEQIYENLIGYWWNPLVIALYLTVLMICIFLPVLIVSFCTNDLSRFRKKKKKFTMFPAALAALLVSGIVLEFLYELCGNGSTQPTSYYFVLDVSGSMNTTDPDRALSSAMQQLVGQMEDGFPYAVYTFSDAVSQEEPLHQKLHSEEENEWDFFYNGGTSMITALDTVLQDIRSSNRKRNWIGGRNPKVILMTDGYATDLNFFNTNLDSVLKQYRKDGIVVCSVSMYGSDEATMQKIADMTGGVHIKVKDVSDLYQMMQSATISGSERTLLSYRAGRQLNALSAVLRVLFLIILGAFAISFLYYGNAVPDDLDLIIWIKAVTAVLAALLTEILLQNTDIAESFVRFLFCLLTAAACLRTWKKKKISVPPVSLNTEPGGGTDFPPSPPPKPKKGKYKI